MHFNLIMNKALAGVILGIPYDTNILPGEITKGRTSLSVLENKDEGEVKKSGNV